MKRSSLDTLKSDFGIGDDGGGGVFDSLLSIGDGSCLWINIICILAYVLYKYNIPSICEILQTSN